MARKSSRWCGLDIISARRQSAMNLDVSETCIPPINAQRLVFLLPMVLRWRAEAPLLPMVLRFRGARGSSAIITLIKIQFHELVTFRSISYLSVVSSKRSKSVFFSGVSKTRGRARQGSGPGSVFFFIYIFHAFFFFLLIQILISHNLHQLCIVTIFPDIKKIKKI